MMTMQPTGISRQARKLPLIILADTSSSMAGAKIATLNQALQNEVQELRADPELKQPTTTNLGSEGKEAAKPQFKELSQEDELQAQKLFEWALAQRKMGRLPGMSYKKMVDACREIIERWPESEYAFKAKRMLADIPERFRSRYNITKEEIDLGDWK